jgi:hypothetical protein
MSPTRRATRWTNVGAAITERMHELGIDQTRLIEAAGVSDFTIRDLMKGVSRNYRDRSLWSVSKALGWSHDSIHCILGGEPPVVIADQMVPADPDPYEAIRDQLAHLAAQVTALAEQSAWNGEVASRNGERLERLRDEVTQIGAKQTQIGSKQESGWDRMGRLEQLAASTLANQKLNQLVEADEAPRLIHDILRRQTGNRKGNRSQRSS